MFIEALWISVKIIQKKTKRYPHLEKQRWEHPVKPGRLWSPADVTVTESCHIFQQMFSSLSPGGLSSCLPPFCFHPRHRYQCLTLSWMTCCCLRYWMTAWKHKDVPVSYWTWSIFIIHILEAMFPLSWTCRAQNFIYRVNKSKFVTSYFCPRLCAMVNLRKTKITWAFSFHISLYLCLFLRTSIILHNSDITMQIWTHKLISWECACFSTENFAWGSAKP